MSKLYNVVAVNLIKVEHMDRSSNRKHEVSMYKNCISNSIVLQDMKNI